MELKVKAVVERLNLVHGSLPEKDVERVVDVSVRAFESARDRDGDISHNAILGRDWTLASSYFRSIILVGLFAGDVYGIRDKESKEFVAVGIWFRPGQRSANWTEEFKCKVGLNDFLDKLQPQFREWYLDTIPRIIREREDFFTDEERSRRWWCIHLCTDPRYHGQGLARSIIDHVHEEAQEAVERGFVALGAGVQVNVQKYQSLGFRKRGELKAPFPDSNEMFEMHVLSRGD
ncbi:hypothetical protein GYMLUDRAFT_40587 [Collybiopsis luxurians FD-317 M1]|uniref:Unplaced genomic scaffold GYMLUscaffold_15, whole genome shotgun sequence n=1 Tax=Collybiopsis luxurians FD-317 M1 TaxID=944289 RepID=A0A0D0CKW9_9AGAR|nr:hypothetical protein GYMLUDRAFT_40587 [Collybiopsis luxurians FD-317 M1]